MAITATMEAMATMVAMATATLHMVVVMVLLMVVVMALLLLMVLLLEIHMRLHTEHLQLQGNRATVKKTAHQIEILSDVCFITCLLRFLPGYL
jgi:uncharacterized membrane protein